MINLDYSVVIKRPAGEVFAYAADIKKAPNWKARLLEVRRISRGKVKVGAREVHVGKFLGRRFETEVEITEYEPNRKIGFRTISGPLSAEGSLTFESLGSGTKVTLTAVRKPSGFLKVISPVLSRIAQRQLETDLGKLKELLEA